MIWTLKSLIVLSLSHALRASLVDPNPIRYPAVVFIICSFFIPSLLRPLYSGLSSFNFPPQRLSAIVSRRSFSTTSCCTLLALENAPCGVAAESARVNPRRGLLGPKHHTHTHVSRGLRLDRRCSLQAFHAVSWTRIHSGDPLFWRGRLSWSTLSFHSRED